MDNIYHSRKFLTPHGQQSWAAIHCFHGYPNEENELVEFQGRTNTYVVLQGCHCSVTLHKTSPDMKDFIDKIRLLSNEINNFANWLEEENYKNGN